MQAQLEQGAYYLSKHSVQLETAESPLSLTSQGAGATQTFPRRFTPAGSIHAAGIGKPAASELNRS